MQLGKVHLPCTRIHHAEIASVQISQGEYYFSGRYKDFFPEGERSFFVGKNWEEDMLKVAIYGKGGIGKSTVTSNLAAAFATMGKRVIQIGCDPKADSTINLLEGKPLRPVMNYMREEDEEPEKLEDISKEGFGGVLCIETGGPTPGLGCAGRGIIATFQLLEDLRLFETYKPDVVLYEEGLDQKTLNAALTAIARADVLIIGGTSLNVYPAAGLINYYRGHKLVLINKSPVARDLTADLVITEPIGQTLSCL